MKPETQLKKQILAAIQQELKETIAHNKRSLALCIKAKKKLESKGFSCHEVTRHNFDSYVLDIEAGDLQRAYQALGPLRMSSKWIEDANKKLVRVELRPKEYPNVYVQYVKKLPKGAKCKIKTTRRSYKSTELVCEL